MIEHPKSPQSETFIGFAVRFDCKPKNEGLLMIYGWMQKFNTETWTWSEMNSTSMVLYLLEINNILMLQDCGRVHEKLELLEEQNWSTHQ